MQRHHGSRVLRLAHRRAAQLTEAWDSACLTKRRTLVSTLPLLLFTAHAARVIAKVPLVQPQSQGGGDAVTASATRAAFSSFGSVGSTEDRHGCQEASITSPSPSCDHTHATTPTLTTADTLLPQLEEAKAAGGSSSGTRAPRRTPRVGADVIGKSRHGPGSTHALKVKKKAPWGAQQLRDSWSEDAMSKRSRENMDERIHREHRYHPEEFRRRYIRYTAFLTIPCIVLGMSMAYYRATDRPIWTADPQHLLNLLRVMDTSPRSKLYAFRLEEAEQLPPHVLEYRRAHEGRRAYDERVFRLTHSAFERPSEDALRRLEVEEKLMEESGDGASAVGEADLMGVVADTTSDEE